MTLRCNNWFCSALSALAVLSGAALLSSCSAAGVGESIPQSLGGLPTGAPTRPVTPGVFPAVHDIPASRRDQALSVEEQDKLEQDLKDLKSRQETRAKTDDDEAQPAPAKKGAAAGAAGGAAKKKTPQTPAGTGKNP